MLRLLPQWQRYSWLHMHWWTDSSPYVSSPLCSEFDIKFEVLSNLKHVYNPRSELLYISSAWTAHGRVSNCGRVVWSFFTGMYSSALTVNVWSSVTLKSSREYCGCVKSENTHLMSQCIICKQMSFNVAWSWCEENNKTWKEETWHKTV